MEVAFISFSAKAEKHRYSQGNTAPILWHRIARSGIQQQPFLGKICQQTRICPAECEVSAYRCSKEAEQVPRRICPAGMNFKRAEGEKVWMLPAA
jgi:hypothetical protein